LSFENRLSVVMRTLGNRPEEISRAIRSVAQSEYSDIEVIVVYQGSDDAIRSNLQALQSLLPVGMSLKIIQNDQRGDQRARNLNLGMEVAGGRWLAFLDDDDFVAKSHYRRLLDAMNETGFAWAYSQTLLRKERINHQVIEESLAFNQVSFSLAELLKQNHIPIHSFIIDRARVNEVLLAEGFCEELSRSEDWDFLIRLAFFHEPAVLSEATCTYCVREGEGNTNLSVMGSQEISERTLANEAAWRESKLLVEARKRSLITTVWWGRACFPEVFEDARVSAETKSGLRRLSDRIIRYSIRRLESLL